MPRVLWVADKLGYEDRMHGLGAYFKQILPAMPQGFVIPVVLRSTDRLLREFEAAGVHLKHLRHGKLDPRTLGSLLGIARDQRIEVMHLHGFGASTFGRLAARASGCAAIIHQHDSIMHAPWYGRLADRALSRWTAAALAVSGTVADYCVEARAIPREKVKVVVNAVSTPRPHDAATIAAWRAAQAIPADARLIGSLTRFTPEKGVSYLIRALPALLAREPKALLLLFGDGAERARLEALAAELGVAQSMRFLGFQPDASRYLGTFECFVLPSVSEGLPFALMEALAAGVPAVATAVGGMAELLRDGEDALLVPAEDPAALAEAVCRVLDDPALARRLRDGALATSGRFSVERHVEALISIYNEAIASVR